MGRNCVVMGHTSSTPLPLGFMAQQTYIGIRSYQRPEDIVTYFTHSQSHIPTPIYTFKCVSRTNEHTFNQESIKAVSTQSFFKFNIRLQQIGRVLKYHRQVQHGYTNTYRKQIHALAVPLSLSLSCFYFQQKTAHQVIRAS